MGSCLATYILLGEGDETSTRLLLKVYRVHSDSVLFIPG